MKIELQRVQPIVRPDEFAEKQGLSCQTWVKKTTIRANLERHSLFRFCQILWAGTINCEDFFGFFTMESFEGPVCCLR